MGQYYIKSGENRKETKKLVEQEITSWLMSKELSAIVESFGGTIPVSFNIKERAKWLLEFSNHWDYRAKQKTAQEHKTKESARWLISNDEITENQKKIVEDNIANLGLIGVTNPVETAFDYIIALGGARMSCLYRPQYVRQLIENERLAPRMVVMLSGMRAISDTEREATDGYALGAETEFDLINAGAEKVFNLPKEYMEERFVCENANRSWAVRTYESKDYAYPIVSISGPSSEPEIRRANSADTFQFFCNKYCINEGSKILLVTSQIYVPYQQMEAIRTWAIPNDVYVETVGFPIEWNKGKQQGMMMAANYLQEIRSMIQSINRYLDEYGD